MWPQVHGLVWQGHPGDCGSVTPSALSGRDIILKTGHVTIDTGSEWGHPRHLDISPQVQGLGQEWPRRLWTCDPRYSVWGGSSADSRLLTTGKDVFKGCHPGECGRVSPGTVCEMEFMLETVDMWIQLLGRGGHSPWRLWTCGNKYRVWQGRVTLETVGSPWKLWTTSPKYRLWEVGSHWKLRTYDPNYRVWEGCYTGACGPVTTGSVSGMWHHTGDCGHMTPGSGSGRESPWRLDVWPQVQDFG